MIMKNHKLIQKLTDDNICQQVEDVMGRWFIDQRMHKQIDKPSSLGGVYTKQVDVWYMMDISVVWHQMDKANY